MKRFKTFACLLFCASCLKTAAGQLTVNVPAGGDVAGASLQVLQAGGGTINLAAGSYYITGSIVLGGNTTINGAGGPGSAMQSVIYAPASPNGIAMVTQAYAGASNLTVSNLVLDGNIPQSAMLYGTGNGNYAYNDTGIYFYDQSATTVGVNLTNVEVRHTLRGILTGLVDNLTISGCYFHDNNPGGFSHNMYLVATSGVEIDHTRSDNALTGDGLHIDFGGFGYTIRKSEFTGNNGLGILSQNDNIVTVEDTKLDFNTNEGIQIDAGGLLLTRDETSENGGYGLQIPDTADNAGVVNGFYSIQNDPLNSGGDYGPDYIYGAALIDFTEGNPGPNAYPAIQADGVLGVTDTGDWTLNYGGYTYLGAVDFNANHLSNGSITFQVGNAVATGLYPLVVRYSNGTGSNQTMNLSINGGSAVPILFPSTGSYSTWSTVTAVEVLNVGNNEVTLSVPAGATSAPELDLLTMTAAKPPVPNAPGNVTAVANGPYSVTLNWAAPANSNGNAAQTYNIYKNNRVPIVATKITGTTWTDTRIFYGETTNSYFVTAVNQGGESAASNSVTVTSGIDAPPGLQVSVVPGTPANNLNWLGVSGAASYLVRRATMSGGPYQTIATVAAKSAYPTYSDSSLAIGTNYYYVVAAVDASGNVSVNSYEVVALAETFSLTAGSSSVNLSSATPDTISVVGTNGFSDAVMFGVTGVPAGVTASLSATSGSSTQITFTANSSAAQGSYPVTITGTDGALSASVGVTVVVGPGLLAQVITFNPIPQQAVGNSLAVFATASSGLPVTFSVVPNGNCSISGNLVTFLNGGACGVIANQAGNANFSAAAAVGQVVQVGAPSAQTITFASIPGQNSGTSIALTATASSGLAVTFTSTTPSVCTVSGSMATLLTGGTCSIVASQAGGGVYGPAKSVTQSFAVTVKVQAQTITFTLPSMVTYGVAPIALNGTASSGLAVSYSVTSGPGSVSGSSLTVTGAGTVVVVASQGGDGSYTAATPVPQSLSVAAAPLTATANAASYVYGSTPPTLTGGLSAMVGTDSFTESYTTNAPAVAPVPAGSYTITPVLAAVAPTLAANYSITYSTAKLTVTQAGTTTKLGALPANIVVGTQVQLTATVLPATTGTPTQSVSFYAGTTLLGTSTLSGGVATLTTSLLPSGSLGVYASYGGDTNFSGSQSAAQITTVGPPPGFSVTSASPTVSIADGQTGTMAISVASVGGYAKTVTASCGGGLPSGLVCAFLPTSLTFTGQNNTLTTTLSLATTLLAGQHAHRGGTAMAGVFWIAGLLGLIGLSSKTLRQRLPGLICMLALVSVAGMSGCGSSHIAETAPGTYSVPVMVSDGSATASVTVTVIIHQ